MATELSLFKPTQSPEHAYLLGRTMVRQPLTFTRAAPAQVASVVRQLLAYGAMRKSEAKGFLQVYKHGVKFGITDAVPVEEVLARDAARQKDMKKSRLHKSANGRIVIRH